MAQLRSWLIVLAGIATSLALSGCSSTEWIPVRYAAPIGPSYEATLATNLCAQRCYHGHREYFYACLAECPGIVVESGATCGEPDDAAEAFCYTEQVPVYVEDDAGDQIASSIVEGFFDLLFNGLVNAAASSGHDDHDEHHEHHEHHEHGHGHSGRSHEPSHSEHREARRSESRSRSSRDESTPPRHRAASPRVR